MDDENQLSQRNGAPDDARDGFIQLKRDLSPLDAQILLGRLQAEGIDAHLSGLEVVQNNPYYRNAFGGVRIFVRADQQAEASEIVATVNSGDYDLDAPEDDENSFQASIRTKRLFGWVVVLILAVLIGGIALGTIWAPSYDYFPYSTTPEPFAHIVGKWVLTALVFAPVALWLYFIEAWIKRKTRR